MKKGGFIYSFFYLGLIGKTSLNRFLICVKIFIKEKTRNHTWFILKKL